MLMRAKVEDVNDPLNLGRIKVRIYGFHDGIPVEDLPWAEPCFILGGEKDYGVFTVPRVGSTVWVSFEVDDTFEPDPNCIVYLGTWYGSGEEPIEADQDKKIIIKTSNKNKIIISDKAGEEGILIQDRNGNKIEIKTDNGNIVIYAKGDMLIQAEGNMTLKANRIDLNP